MGSDLSWKEREGRTNDVAPDGRMLNVPGARLTGVAFRGARRTRHAMRDLENIGGVGGVVDDGTWRVCGWNRVI